MEYRNLTPSETMQVHEMHNLKRRYDDLEVNGGRRIQSGIKSSAGMAQKIIETMFI